MSTAIRLHPWFREVRLSTGNAVRASLERRGEALFHGLAWVVLLALLAWAWQYLDGDRPGLILQGLARQPLLAIAILAGSALAVTRAAGVALRRELRLGWWGAMPIAPGQVRTATVLVGALLALAQFLGVLGVLGAIALVAKYWDRWFAPLVTTAAYAIPLGAALGWWLAERAGRGGEDEGARAHLHGKPALALPLLEAGSLAGIAIWQRIETVSRWRAGGAAWAIALIASLVPAGTAWTSLSGLMLFVVTVAWLIVALRSSEDVIVASAELTAATPMGLGRLARACGRFPVFAALGAGASGAFALRLQGAPTAFVLAYAAIVFAAVALQFVLVLRHRFQPSRARLAFAVAVAVLAASAQVLPPLVPLLYLALLLHHLRQASLAR